MKNLIFRTLFCCALPLLFSGCLVAESHYLQKVNESEQLTKERDELQQKLNDLQKVQETVKVELEILKKSSDTLAVEKDKLIRDKTDLEQVLKAKSDTLSKSNSDLRQKISEIETENIRIKNDIASLQKQKEQKVHEVSNTYELLLQNMKSEIAQGQVTISELKGKLTVNMEAAILFDSGKADIKPDGLIILMKMMDTLKKVTDKAIRVEGHTDNIQISGGLTRLFPTNWELSAARAINVTKYLQNQGVDPTILSAAAFGEQKPVADNSSREGRAKNRRIELSLVAKEL